MAKQRISRVLNTLETLGEIPKRAVSETLRTFNPLEAFNNSPSTDIVNSPEQQRPKDHTPLNVDKVKGEHELSDLETKKKRDEQQKLAEVRNRLFQRVTGEQDREIKRGAQTEQQEKEQELTDEQRRQEEIKRRLAARQNDDAPQGKEARGGLFAKKKKRTKLAAQENQPEMKGSGKH